MRIPKPSRLAAALAAAHLLVAALPAAANPVNPNVVAGSAAFAQHGKLLSITNSPGTIINWGGFSIRADEITRFIQNGADSAVLNRVTGAESSQLLGQLLSNGRVFLINPNGIAIGAGARIDTAGFIASSLNMSNADFLSGRLRFESAGNPAAVTNHGVIVGNGGLVALIGGDVQNRGNVSAGQVALAAGRKVELLDAASPNIRVQVEGGLDQTNLNRVLQAGTISAALPGAGDAVGARIEGGRVLLVAAGNVTATSGSDTLATGHTGGTVLAHAQGGDLQVGGRVDALGTGGSGGGIDLLGRRIDVQAGAVVDTSGTHGGGQIRVGGDYQGRNAAVPNASQTRIEAGADLRADAREFGDGGRIIAWADGATAASGSISARGGAQAGNGGFVEVSGKGVLHFDGRVDTTAPRGNAGTLLLDPANVTITNTADAFAGGSFAAGEFGGATGTSTITWGTLETQLIAGNVVVTTSGSGGAGNLTLSGSRTYNSPHNLSFLAHNDVSLGAGGFVVNNGSGGLTFVAGWDGASVASPAVTTGTGNMGIGWGFQSGGALKFQAGGTIAAGTYNNGSEFLRSIGSTLSLLAGGNIDLNNNCCGPGTDTMRSAGLMTITSTNGHVINSRPVNLIGTGGLAISAGSNIGNVTTGGNLGSMTATGTGANITLNAGTSGSGGILFNGAVPVTADNNVTMTAVNRINFASSVPVTATNGNLSLTSSAADVVQTGGGASSFTAGGNVTINAVTGISLGGLTAGSGGDGMLTVTNTGATSDVGLGGNVRANKAGLAANQFAVDISSARDLFLSSFNNGTTTGNSTLATGGMRFTAARNIDLNTNGGGPGTDTYTSAGDLVINANTGQITNGRQVNLAGRNITMTAGTNIGNVTTGGNLGSITASGTGANITLNAGASGSGGILFNGAVPVTADNNVTMTAANRIEFASSVPVTATNGHLNLASSAANIVQTFGGASTFTAKGNVTINAVTGISLGGLTAGSGGDGVLTVTNTGATSDVGLGGNVRANKAGLAANQFAVDISSARDLFLSSFNNGTTTGVSALSTGGMRFVAARNVDLNSNGGGAGSDTYTAAGDLVITATAGQIVNSRLVNLAGKNITMTAGTHIGNVTTGGSMGSLSASGTGSNLSLIAGTTGSGGIRIAHSGAVTAANNLTMQAVDRIDFATSTPVVANSGNLNLTSSAADIVQTGGGASSLTAGGNVTVSAVTGVSFGGGMTAGSGGDGTLTVTSTGAGGDVALGLSRATKAGLAANQYAIDVSSGRDINLNSFNNGTTNAVSSLATGGMRFAAARHINLNNNCCGPGSDTYTSAGDLVVTATTGQITNGRLVNLAGKNITLTAGTHIGDVTTGGSLGSLIATGIGSNLSLTAGTTGSGGIRISGSGALTAANNLTMQAVDRVDFATSTPVTATSGNLSLTSSAADIVQTGGGASSLTAGGNVSVSAVTGVSFGGGMTAGSGGDGTLTITSTGATGDIGLGLSRATKAGLSGNQYAIDVSSGRDINLNSFNNGTTNAVSSLATGGMRFAAARHINLNNNCCGPGTDTYTSAGDFVLTATGGQITQGRTVNLSGNRVYLNANTAINVTGNVNAPDTISYSLTNSDLTVSSLTATNVILNSTNGAILDGNGGTTNVTATTLTATARTGINLDTNVGSLSASNSGTGAVALREANGATVTGLGTTAGTVTLTTASGTLTNTGTVTLPGGATISGAFANQGTLNITGGTADFGTAAFGMDSGTVNVSGGATLSKAGGTLTWNGGTLAGTGTYTLPTVALGGSGARVLNGPTINAGATTLASGSLTVQNGTFNAAGNTSIGAGTALDVTGGSFVQSGALFDVAGTVRMSGGALGANTLALAPGGRLEGTGTLTGNLNNASGTVAPGASPGLLTVTGNYTQGPAATLAIELAGTTPGTGFDRVAVGGNASLNGTLAVTVPGPFAPATNDTFRFITTGGTRSGNFSATTLPTGFVGAVTYGTNFADLGFTTVPGGAAATSAAATTRGTSAPTSSSDTLVAINRLNYPTTAEVASEEETDDAAVLVCR